MPGNPPANRYSHTPRAVFERAIDRIEIRRLRDKEDVRTDLAFLLGKIQQLEETIEELLDPLEKKKDPDDLPN